MNQTIDTQEQQLETKALTWPERARKVSIVDQRTYDTAVDLIKGATVLRGEIVSHHEPIKKSAWAAHKAAVAAEKKLLAPVDEALSILRGSIGDWDRRQEQLRRQEEARQREEARRQEIERRKSEAESLAAQRKAEEEARLSAAVEAEKSGASAEEVDFVMDAPEEFTPTPPVSIPVSAPRSTPTYQKAAGISRREVWSAEVVSIQELVRAVADGKAPITLIQANNTALNGMARSLKSAMAVPGVRAVCQSTTNVRVS